VSLVKNERAQLSGISDPSAADFACREVPIFEEAKSLTRLDADGFGDLLSAPKKGKFVFQGGV